MDELGVTDVEAVTPVELERVWLDPVDEEAERVAGREEARHMRQEDDDERPRRHDPLDPEKEEDDEIVTFHPPHDTLEELAEKMGRIERP